MKMYRIISELEDRLSIKNKSRWTNSTNITFQNDSITDPPPGTWGEFSSFHIPPTFHKRNAGSNSEYWSTIKSQTASLTKSVSDKIKTVARKLEESSPIIGNANQPILKNTTPVQVNTHPAGLVNTNPATSLYVPPNMAAGLATDTGMSQLNNNPFLGASAYADESTYITASNSFDTYNTFDPTINPLNSEINFPQNIESPPFANEDLSSLANEDVFANDVRPNTAFVNKLTQNASYDPLMNDSF